MENTKKDLLIFFGEFRTFDVILPQLKDLDKVDIIVSTWESGVDTPIDEKYDIESARQYIPHATFLLEPDLSYKLTRTYKMYYHWRKAINYVSDDTQYNNVIIHRIDMISNWHRILNSNLNEDTLYINYRGSEELNSFFINDYFIIGKFSIIKKFINLITDNECSEPHFPLGNLILNKKIKFKNEEINGVLIKKFMKDYINELNNKNINLLETEFDSPYKKKFVELHNALSENYKLPINFFGIS